MRTDDDFSAFDDSNRFLGFGRVGPLPSLPYSLKVSDIETFVENRERAGMRNVRKKVGVHWAVRDPLHSPPLAGTQFRPS